MNDISIYKDILTNINVGELPDDYQITDDSDNEFNFTPGAFDGLLHYHTVSSFGADEKRLMMKAIKAGADGNYNVGEICIKAFPEETRVISYYDEITDYVSKHSKRLDAYHVHEFAMHLILNSDSAECVKFGLALLLLFDTEQPDTMNIIRTLGAYDEFTVFCARIISNWENGNKELFKLAKKVHGWGRIHIVDMLECDSDKIRSWLISEGIKNTVTPSYSVYPVWEKANCEELIYDESISYDCFRSLGEILVALIDDGPVKATGAIDNLDDIFLEYFIRSDSFELQVEDYCNINIIGQYISRGFDEEGFEPTEAFFKVMEIMNHDDIDQVVRNAARQGKGLMLARPLQLDLSEEFYEYLCNNFEDAVSDIGYLFLNPDYIDKALAEASKYYNEETLCGEFTNNRFSDNDDSICKLLYELAGYPLHGIDIVKATLFAPTVLIRSYAVDVLIAWVRESEKQLAELSPELYTAVEKLESIESSEENTENIVSLLNGTVSFEEDEDNE